MNKIIYIFLIAIAILSTAVRADENPKIAQPLLKKEKASGEQCFNENSHIINIGVGFGSSSYYRVAKYGSYSYRRSPAFSISYEQAYKKKLGPGYLGVGAYFGYQGATYTNTYLNNYAFPYNNVQYTYKYHWNYFSLAARAAYHWDVLNFKNGDVYAGVLIGFRFQTYSYTNNDPDPYYNTFYNINQRALWPSYSVFAGARWWFANNFGVYAEAGYGISYLTCGLSFKF